MCFIFYSFLTGQNSKKNSDQIGSFVVFIHTKFDPNKKATTIYYNTNLIVYEMICFVLHSIT